MIDRLKAWLTEGQGEFSNSRDELQLAVAALLMDAAQVDGHLDAPERVAAERVLARRFGLSPSDAHQLAALAEARAERSTQLFGFTRVVNERLSRPQRIGLIEMLWEVAYADGVLDPLEDAMLRQVAGLIDVSDHERGSARLRTLQRLGIADAG